MESPNWNEIKEKLAKAVKLEKDINNLIVKITIIESDIKENQMIGNMLNSEEEIKHSLAHFINQGKPIDCNIEVNQQNKYILIKFQDINLWNKAYELFNEIFFGDYLKKMFDAMLGAFGGMFGRDT